MDELVGREVEHRVLEVAPPAWGYEGVGEVTEVLRVRWQVEEARDHPPHVRVHCGAVFTERVYQNRTRGVSSDAAEVQ
jgi:hypothetical protein